MTSRFDWYSATFEGLDAERVAHELAIAHGGTISLGRGRFGYSRRYSIDHSEETWVNVYGGSATAGEVHVEIMSQGCDKYVPFVRNLWPEHRVSRADSALDFKGDYEALKQICLDFAEVRGLSHRFIQDSAGGACLYLGSASSENQIRFYKKSEQLLFKYPDRADEIPPGILRLELQTRPGKRAKKDRLSVLNAEDLWGLGRWTSELAKLILDLDVERVKVEVNPTSEWSKMLHFLGKQYGPGIARRMETHEPEEVLLEVLKALGIQGIFPEGEADGSAPQGLQAERVQRDEPPAPMTGWALLGAAPDSGTRS